MGLSDALRLKFQKESLFRNAKAIMAMRVGDPSTEQIESDVLKIIAKRANLPLRYFKKTDILTEPDLVFNATRLHALTISLNKYLDHYGKENVKYKEISASKATVSRVIELVGKKF